MFKNLIFDWSGTLVDDLGPVVDGTNAVLSQHQKPALDRDSFRKTFTLPYGAWWESQIPGLPLEDVETLFRQGFAASQHEVPLLPGAREVLAACKRRGARLFILSSMDEPAFEKQREALGLEDTFEATYVGVLDKRDVIGEILKTHNLTPDETVFIGDMVHDIETAHHAQISSIGVDTGYTDGTVLAASRPTFLLQDLGKLPELVTGAFRQDEIIISGLKVETYIGVPEEERATPQTLELDLVLSTNPFPSADEIDRTVDYHAVCTLVRKFAGEGERKLIETLAQEVAALILENFAVQTVELEIRKFILPETSSVGCRVKRSR